MEYYSPDNDATTKRLVEPFALYSTQENWLLIAWCRLRMDFRSFRLDRIKTLNLLDEQFEPQKMSLQEYFKICLEKSSQPLT
ncbi:WYL domain-containing protein [Pedobacter sp. HCMS5-2]|uniref:WYL domain-containing protein n=1 Tax=Pedobacter punctiformis TaxID=3004097 RepID=A0ABT4LAA9_9SPHI|nr:WYL domain-containing protein [Pedobacter sp. HCMS5-2]MCZ4244838.1 WYL domain-containing protein [Pedobacter sp. HCMS5-2]